MPLLLGLDTGGTYTDAVLFDQDSGVIASANAPLQVFIATQFGGRYSIALAGVAIAAALVIAVLASLGREARDIDLNTT